MKLFDFQNYKEFTLNHLSTLPKRGRGQFRKIALFLHVHTTFVSQVFSGDLNLTLEQALNLTEYWGMNKKEEEYFLLLVQLERAGSKALKDFFLKQIINRQEDYLKLSKKEPSNKELDDRDQALFYSEWFYSGIRLLAGVPGANSPHSLASKLGLPIKTVNEVIEFLVRVGLVEWKDQTLQLVDKHTTLSNESMLVGRHHQNWRTKVVSYAHNLSNDEAMYTNPILISAKDFVRVRKEIVVFLEKFREIAYPSPSELLACLNIDWVKIV